MSQYLGDISAYALAVSQGYTGTEEEYAELMASYATVGQTAVTAAQTAATKASEAATSATTATTKASEATTAATTATNKAAEAQADADAAALDASQAMSAASTATTKATEATTAAATAVSAKDDAVSANTAAQSAKTAAQTAQTGAETAAASVQSSAEQIATNAEDISQLKSDFDWLSNEVYDANIVEAPTATTRIESSYINPWGVKAKKPFILKSIKTPYVGDTLGSYKVDIWRYQQDQTWSIESALSKTGVTPGDTVDIITQINTNDVISITNVYPLVDDTTANCYATDTPSDEYLEYFGLMQGYNTSAHKFSDYSGRYFAGDITMVFPKIPSLDAHIDIVDKTVEDLRAIKGEYQEQTVTITNDKYVYCGSMSDRTSGTVQNDTGAGFTSVTANEGERFLISGAGNVNKPLIVEFSDNAINHNNLVGAKAVTSSQAIYTNYEYVVPAGVKMFTVNSTNISSYPITVKKFVPTEKVRYLADLSINSFANNPLQYVGTEISLFDKILCIGDSLTAGGFNTPPITPDESHQTRDESTDMYSYPLNLKKNYGCNYTKKATGGITSSGWIETYGSDDLTGHDACIIFLGSNDYMLVRDSGMTPEQAIQTNYSNIMSIISLVRSQNYGIPIFLCTSFPGWADAYNVAVGCSVNMRDICSAESGVYLIDFNNYSKLKDGTGYRYTHPTALGYMQMAKEIAGAVCYHITQNPTDFKWIQFVGKRWAVEIS